MLSKEKKNLKGKEITCVLAPHMRLTASAWAWNREGE